MFSLCVDGLLLDFSKNLIDSEVLRVPIELAGAAGLGKRIEEMFTGTRINTTEDRAVAHTALRAAKGACIDIGGTDVVGAVRQVLEVMADFANRVRSGSWLGHTGKPIKNVVNIGIGGSDLGPVMAYEALSAYSDRRLKVRFVSNMDGSEVVSAVQGLDQSETLYVNVSKSFTTKETLTNARTARRFLIRCTRRRRSCSPTFRSRLNQCRASTQIRHRPRQHVWRLGRGRWPVLARFCCRPGVDDRDRPGKL